MAAQNEKMEQAIEGSKKVQKKFKTVVTQITKSHRTELRNIKKESIQESIRFVKRSSKGISRMLSSELHSVVN